MRKVLFLAIIVIAFLLVMKFVKPSEKVVEQTTVEKVENSNAAAPVTVVEEKKEVVEEVKKDENPTPVVDAEKAVKVTNAWIRPANKDGNTALYFQVNASKEDNLLKATCAKSDNVDLHKTVTDAATSTSSMEHLDKVMIPVGTTVEFAPTGLHVMLMNVKEDLKENDKVSVTLTFEHAGDITVDAIVKNS